MVTQKITSAEIPEAKKLASEDARPACWNRRGAYYAEVVLADRIWKEMKVNYIRKALRQCR